MSDKEKVSGEEVEVICWINPEHLYAFRKLHEGTKGLWAVNMKSGGATEPLMTVSQHQRRRKTNYDFSDLKLEGM